MAMAVRSDSEDTMAARSDSEDNDDSSTIPEVTFEGQDDFLQEIHERFLKLVAPRESGLLDHLRETVMDSDTEQEIMAEKTRRDKARKLWKVFRHMSLEDFRDHCYPILKTLYPHVLEGARFIPNTSEDGVEKCVRHVIMERVKLRRFADLLTAAHGCTPEEYNKLTEGEADESKWELAFKLCVKNKNSDIFIQKFQAILMDIKARVPSDFSAILSKGFPCSCKLRKQRTSQEKSVPARAKGVKRKADEISLHPWNWQTPTDSILVSSCSYPSTLDNSVDNGDSSASISSHETITEVMGESGGEETQFDTLEQKDAYLEELEWTDALMEKVLSIKPSFRKLTSIKEMLCVLEETSESEHIHSFNYRDKRDQLQVSAKRLYDKIHKDFKEVEGAANIIEDTALAFTFQLPFARRKFLLERRKIFLNEMNEAYFFFKQSVSLFLSMSIPPCVNSRFVAEWDERQLDSYMVEIANGSMITHYSQ